MSLYPQEHYEAIVHAGDPNNIYWLKCLDLAKEISHDGEKGFVIESLHSASS